MGLPTLSNRQRPGLFDVLELWDTNVVGDGSGASNDRTVPDQLEGFSSAIVNVRWATTAVSIVLAAGAMLQPSWPTIVAMLAVLANTIYRSLSPLAYTGSPSDQTALLFEVSLSWLAVAGTGFWLSPLVLSMAGVLVVAGFARGFRMALRIGGVMTIGLTIVGFAFTDWTPERMSEAVQWSTLLLLTAVIAGYGRRISGEADRQHTKTMDRVSQLSDANTLLFNLHRLTQTLPASLDQTEVLDSSLMKLRGMLDFDRALFLLHEDSDRSWMVGRQQALGVSGTIDTSVLPAAARSAIAGLRTVHTTDLHADGGGLHPSSASGLYAPLTARDRLIGLVVVESRLKDHFDDHDRRTLEGFIETMALALDNARWFGRLRRVSVDEERSRIARELHDRIGQSLACLGFDVDRLVRHHENGADIGSELLSIRTGVRAVTGEVRDALYDLRADVAENKDFEQTILEFAGRLTERSNLQIDVDSDASARLPLLQEREMWRIAQEALINVERHAGASAVTVTWRCDNRQALLDVVDNGRGMAETRAGRIDSYGIVGMRERANSIGAALDIISEPGEGTTVRCYLNQT